MIRETFPKNIRLEDNFPARTWPDHGRPTQVHQVILNLCVNARDAMPSGGTLSLRAENCLLDAEAAAEARGSRPGRLARPAHRGHGHGHPGDNLAHIWEPFFTTKEAGKGTGLGLSTVRGIVENHKGLHQS